MVSGEDNEDGFTVYKALQVHYAPAVIQNIGQVGANVAAMNALRAKRPADMKKLIAALVLRAKRYYEHHRTRYPDAQLISYTYMMCDPETKRVILPYSGVGAKFEDVKRRVLEYANAMEAPDTGAKPMDLSALESGEALKEFEVPTVAAEIQTKGVERDADGYSLEDWRLWSLAQVPAEAPGTFDRLNWKDKWEQMRRR